MVIFYVAAVIISLLYDHDGMTNRAILVVLFAILVAIIDISRNIKDKK